MHEVSVNEKELDLKNIAKVANVEVTLCAELGRAKLSLKDAIEYDSGSIITLDKINNEPINVYVDDGILTNIENKGDGVKRRKTVRGNTISEDIVLINTIVTKAGSKSISDILNPEEEEAEE